MAVKFENSRGDLTSYAGLAIAEEIGAKSGLRKALIDHLPMSERKTSLRNKDFSKALSYVYGFVVGADCINDLERLYEDCGFRHFCRNHSFTASCLGGFLKNLSQYNITKISENLRDFAFRSRLQTVQDRDFIIDIDSTFHEQCAKQMEGLEYNYENKWGLSSIEAFDQYGFQYFMGVRHGSAFTANGAPGIIRHVFARVPRTMHRILRADSGYCNYDVIRACKDLRVDFVIAARENMYKKYIHRVKTWRKPKEDIKLRDGRCCEVGSTVYYAKGINQAYRIVFMRARKKQPSLFEGQYDYRAFLTSYGEHEKKDWQVILFYRKRGNAENFIKEIKNGYDLHHFPCQRLNANKAYGLLAAYAHNIMRVMAHRLDSEQVPYHKRIRFRMICIAGQVVKKARQTIIRVRESFRKEVHAWLTMNQNISNGTG
ncbi:MAG: IS1380 family transposase [Pseudobacteriovorax sp.]|nr:IS1380 family transposase [Pseudobacteriovorax sp.]